MDKQIGEYLRNTKFVVRVNYGGVNQQISALSIKFGEIIWIDQITGYQLIDKHSGIHPSNFKEIPHKELNASHLKDVYDKPAKIDPIIKKQLSTHELYHFLIDCPEDLLEILRGHQDDQESENSRGIRLVPETNTVYKDGTTYLLTPNQFNVVEILEKASGQSEPWVTWLSIKRNSNISGPKMYDVFKGRNKMAKKELVEYDKSRNAYRLKI